MLLNSLVLLSVFLLVGGPLFYVLVWGRVYSNEDTLTRLLLRRITLFMFISGVFFIISGLVVDLNALNQLNQTGIRALLFETRYGISLLNVVFVPVFIACFMKLSAARNSCWYAGMLISGLAILWTHSETAHTAAVPGLLPSVSNFIHLLAAVVWGGGLLVFLFLPWSSLKTHINQNGPRFWMVVHRFSNLAIILFGIVFLTGAVLTVVHVHGKAAMDSTLYGLTLKLKIVMAAVLLGTLFLNLLKFVPALKPGSEGPGDQKLLLSVARFRIIANIEALVITGLLLVSGVLSTYEPPDTAPFLNPQSWTMTTGNIPVRVEMQPVTGSTTSARFEIFLPDTQEVSSGIRVVFNLLLLDSDLGFHEIDAVQVSPNSYLGEASFPLPGDWRLEVIIEGLNNTPVTGVHDLAIPSQPLIDDLRTYISLPAIAYTSSNMITFVVGFLLALMFGWLLWQSRLGKFPAWITIAGLSGSALGFYMMLNIALVKTYPSTFWKNPEPYTAEVIGAGKHDYIAKCAECHGETGGGDGPWAKELRGSIPALSSPHLDIHTDGEIYWWITHGIPLLDMPPLGDELIDSQRWSIINYVRSLRHGVPG